MEKTWLVTAKPYTKTKDSPQILDYVRQHISKPGDIYLICREVGTPLHPAKRIHAHSVISSKRDLRKLLHEKRTRRYRYDVQSLDSPSDIERALKYICKEAHERDFYLYTDYRHSK